jgi:adenylate cyclase
MMAGGKIHQYVGDEVVVSWKLKEQMMTDKCLVAYFNCRSKLVALADKYQATYGMTPDFKCALHCGPVICGEVGEVKSEIVFNGDTINATARLERMCATLGQGVLISAEFHTRLSPHWQSNFRLREELRVKGRQKPLRVYEVADTSEIQLPCELQSLRIGVA